MIPVADVIDLLPRSCYFDFDAPAMHQAGHVFRAQFTEHTDAKCKQLKRFVHQIRLISTLQRRNRTPHSVAQSFTFPLAAAISPG
jgi:hypothetical protein